MALSKEDKDIINVKKEEGWELIGNASLLKTISKKEWKKAYEQGYRFLLTPLSKGFAIFRRLVR